MTWVYEPRLYIDFLYLVKPYMLAGMFAEFRSLHPNTDVYFDTTVLGRFVKMTGAVLTEHGYKVNTGVKLMTNTVENRFATLSAKGKLAYTKAKDAEVATTGHSVQADYALLHGAYDKIK
jgi:hypothetical protein